MCLYLLYEYQLHIRSALFFHFILVFHGSVMIKSFKECMRKVCEFFREFLSSHRSFPVLALLISGPFPPSMRFDLSSEVSLYSESFPEIEARKVRGSFYIAQSKPAGACTRDSVCCNKNEDILES